MTFVISFEFYCKNEELYYSMFQYFSYTQHMEESNLSEYFYRITTEDFKI